MTGRERIMKVLRGEEPDRIPFAPLIGVYYIRSLKELGFSLSELGDIREVKGRKYLEQKYLGIENYYEVQFPRYIGADIMYRHIFPYQVEYDGEVEAFAKEDKGKTISGFNTSSGSITQEVIFSGGTDFISKHMIQNAQDLKVYREVVKAMRITPEHEYFDEIDEFIADDGIATLTGPLSPLEEFLQFKSGLMNVVNLMATEKQLLEETFNELHQVHKDIYRMLADNNADVTMTYEDTSTTVLSPKWYDTYCEEQLNDYSDILHEKGKIHIVHMCGKIAQLTGTIAEGRMDGIDSVCPPSTGDLEPGAALNEIGKVIIGGLNPVELAQRDVQGVLEYTKEKLSQVGSGRDFILCTGDSTAAGTPVENLRAIADYMKEHGSYPYAGGKAVQGNKEPDIRRESVEPVKISDPGLLMEIAENLQDGEAEEVRNLVEKAIEEGISAQQILDEGLLHGMGIVGEQFRINEIFVPEVLMSARAMNFGMEVLKPLLLSEGVKKVGKVVIGTVKGDLHDIGKNLVKLMMEGRGLEVIDLGTDVSPTDFVAKAKEEKAQVIACSALLTTTMIKMEEVVEEVEARGLKEEIKVLVGGAPINQGFADRIGADGFAGDGATAAELAVQACLV